MAGLLFALFTIPIYIFKQIYKMTALQKIYPIDRADVHTAASYGQQQQAQDGTVYTGQSTQSVMHNADTMGNLGWHKSFVNDTVDVGLRFHYPSEQARRQFQADRFLVFMRFKGDKGRKMYDKLMTSVGGTAGIAQALTQIEQQALKYGGESIKPVVTLARTTIYTVNAIVSPLLSFGSVMSNGALSVFNMVTRPFSGASFDPATELEQSMPTHRVTNNKSVWIPTQGTVHLVTLESKTANQAADSAAADHNKLYELSFDFPPNKVKGAQDLINPNLTTEEKATKAVKLVIESIVTVPFLAPLAGKIAETVLHEVLGKKADKKAQ